ncbi:chain-length determining protein [Paraburkholderia sp. BCC1886]|uniref:chain-length determining protein n=1 Tax=Paraburkholderia sp. BCC1886 TaxID=2562670 RepID=UPI0021B1BCF2|nr:chain-length determining protein [Paraburkholderia sp. BCC1886]
MKEQIAAETMRSGPGWAGAYEKLRTALLSVRVFRLITWMIIVFTIISIPYWLFVASDRYVSQATIILQRTDQANSSSLVIPAIAAAGGASLASTDQLLLREYLLSEDMLEKLDAALELRAHYSDWRRDPVSRMWFKNAPKEQFYQYWLNRISVDYDTYSGVLRINAQAYDSKTANAIVELMVQLGEAHMNEIGHQLAQSQVDFLSKQVTLAHDRFLGATQDLISFQNRKGLAAPQNTAESANTLIDNLEAQKAAVETQLASLPPNLNRDQPTVMMLKQNISALRQQIAQKRAELASPTNRTLNYTVEEYQRLQLQASFAQDLYKTALTSLEQGRMDAARMLKMVSILQSPTMPDYPLAPTRFYNAFVTLLIGLSIIGVAKLLESIILDHVD